RTLNPRISPAVESIALRALEKRRDARPQTAGEMARGLVAAARSVMAGLAHPTKGAAPGAGSAAPKATPIMNEVVASESNSSVAPSFGDVSTKTGSSRRLVLAVFGALLLLAGGGLWGYMRKGGNERVAAANASTGSDKRASTVNGQPATPER